MVDGTYELERGRESYARRAWMDAYDLLSHADRVSTLGAEDLELLATSAYMLGRDDECLGVLERAYHVCLEAGEALRAVRCAVWVGINLALRGETGRATGWLGRARRLVEREVEDCVERGYLLIPAMLRHDALGDWETAYAIAADATEIGERFGDADLFALTVHEQGCALIQQGRVEEGLGLLDEAMVAVTAGEVSPIVTGMVYCGVISGCQEVYALRRAREWTATLTGWCEEQPDMVAFSGTCMVHRAEIMELHGAWRDALEETRRARKRGEQGNNRLAVAQAFYRQGELHRLQGEFSASEEAYRDASWYGREPQPGLALLRLAQGNDVAAAAAIHRAVGETTDPLKRARLLPAYVEIMLAVGNVEEARSASRELQDISVRYESGMLNAMVAHARGAVDLIEGDARAALLALRRAWQAWQELEVPYEVARVRVLIGLACRALGDEDTAALELEAARDAFAQLGAKPDLARVESLTRSAASVNARGLTQRELLDANERVGDSWRKRWDSLRLFTPARYSGLPGWRFPAPAVSFPTKDEMADYLEAYAARFDLPVRTGVKVDELSREGDRFVLASGDHRFESNRVVVATGANQVPKVPAFADELRPSIVQLHSSQYRHPSQLGEGAVLVVGAGNSGAEIAFEVSRTRPHACREIPPDRSPSVTDPRRPGSSSPWCGSSAITC